MQEAKGKGEEKQVYLTSLGNAIRLTTNLRNHLSNRLDYLYGKARKMAEVKTDLKLPSASPYTLADIVDEDWLPEIR
ncbi:DUF29 family protein [Microcystis aeruginosa FBCC-A68]|jgi:hypothetical protein|uniref:DUF29 family protein n=1 Tax=Microcystis TaxID=1125 RepID=UPI0009A1FC7C|nr:MULTISPECIES: DUF29 family protein [Microcystis]